MIVGDRGLAEHQTRARREPALGDRRELDRIALGEPFDPVAHRGLEQRGEPGLELFDRALAPLAWRPCRRAPADACAPSNAHGGSASTVCRAGVAPGWSAKKRHTWSSRPARRPRRAGELERASATGSDLGRLIDELGGGAAIRQHRAVDHQAHLAAAEERVGAEVGEERAEVGRPAVGLDPRAVWGRASASAMRCAAASASTGSPLTR